MMDFCAELCKRWKNTFFFTFQRILEMLQWLYKEDKGVDEEQLSELQ